MDMSDYEEFRKTEWERMLKKIRNDFERLYSAIYQQTIHSYENKSKEIEFALERMIETAKIEYVEKAKILDKLQMEYEEVLETHSHQQELLMSGEESYGM